MFQKSILSQKREKIRFQKLYFFPFQSKTNFRLNQTPRICAFVRLSVTDLSIKPLYRLHLVHRSNLLRQSAVKFLLQHLRRRLLLLLQEMKAFVSMPKVSRQESHSV